MPENRYVIVANGVIVNTILWNPDEEPGLFGPEALLESVAMSLGIPYPTSPSEE